MAKVCLLEVTSGGAEPYGAVGCLSPKKILCFFHTEADREGNIVIGYEMRNSRIWLPERKLYDITERIWESM